VSDERDSRGATFEESIAIGDVVVAEDNFIDIDVNHFLSRPRRLWRASTQRKYWPLIALMALYVAWILFLCSKEFYGFEYPPFDLAIFDQGLWLLTHFHAPFVTIMGRDLFGDHTSFILLLVAPIYRLFPEPQGLLVLQTFSIAAAAIPIYLLAQKMIRNTAISSLLILAYFINPALQQGNLEQFHPEAFQVLIISLAIYAAVESKGALLAVMVGLSLLVKEDVALLLVPLGLWVMWRRNKTWGLRIIVASVVYGLIANLWIIPAILGPNNFYSSRIPFGGVSGFFSTIFRRPGQVVSYLKSDGREFYVWQLGFSYAWAFLLAPEIAAIALLVILENVFSLDPYMHQIVYHYSLEIVPVFAMGTVFAISRQKSVRRRNIATALVVVTAIWSCFLWGLSPVSRDRVFTLYPPGSAQAGDMNSLIAKIPSNAVVSAWYPLVAHLDHREQIYVWPNPFSASNYGLGNNDGDRLSVASQVQYLVLPTSLGPTFDQKVYNKISSNFTLVTTADAVGLYKRNAP
jgi:uncharacterized membrane protein